MPTDRKGVPAPIRSARPSGNPPRKSVSQGARGSGFRRRHVLSPSHGHPRFRRPDASAAAPPGALRLRRKLAISEPPSGRRRASWTEANRLSRDSADDRLIAGRLPVTVLPNLGSASVSSCNGTGWPASLERSASGVCYSQAAASAEHVSDVPMFTRSSPMESRYVGVLTNEALQQLVLTKFWQSAQLSAQFVAPIDHRAS